MQENVRPTSLKPRGNQTARWLVLIGGVINPIVFVLAYTVGASCVLGTPRFTRRLATWALGPTDC
jgi:hypothetical protein